MLGYELRWDSPNTVERREGLKVWRIEGRSKRDGKYNKWPELIIKIDEQKWVSHMLRHRTARCEKE